MNLYVLNKQVNAIASKKGRTCSEQTRLCSMLQDAEAAGFKIHFDKGTQKYFIERGKSNG